MSLAIGRKVAVVTAAGLCAVLLAGCGSSSKSGSGAQAAATSASASPTPSATAPADPAAAQKEIETNWAAFFNTSTPQAQKVALLQDAGSLGQALAVAAKENPSGKEDAKVTAVAFTSPTQASVTYTLNVNGSPVLPNASGVAVLDGGQWKVSKVTFCTLVALGAGGKPVPGCS